MTAVRVDVEGHALDVSKQGGEGGARDGGLGVERSRSGTSRTRETDADNAVRDAGVSVMLDVLRPNLQRRDVRDQTVGSDRSASVKDLRMKMDRDLTSIRWEDVERKREEIGKERPRLRDENERRKEALALLRFKLEAHVRRTERKAALEGRRAADGGEQRGKLGNRAGERVKVQETEGEEEAVVIVSGSSHPELTARVDPDAAQIGGGTEGPVAGYGASGYSESDNVPVSDNRHALPSAAGEESNVAVKDIYVVESATSVKGPTGDGCNDDGREEERMSSAAMLGYPERDSIQVPTSKASNKGSSKEGSASHYKLAEKVARLMEDLEDPVVTDSNLPRLQVRVMDDSETGPIVLMKCSSRDHARVICETLSSKLGPQETILTDTSEGSKRQHYHFQFKGPNLLTFLKKAFSSKARSKSRQQKTSDRSGSTGNDFDSQTCDSALFDSGYFNDGSKVFSGHMAEYLAATWGKESARPGRDVSYDSRDVSDGKLEQGSRRERASDDDVCDAQGRKVRSANSSPSVSGAPGDSAGSSRSKSRYVAGLLATPARTLDRVTSVGRNRSTQKRGDEKTQYGRFFGFVSPGRGALQHSFEDRLGPANVDDEVKAEKTKNKSRHFGVLQSMKRKKKLAGTGGESPLHERELWSGMLVGSPGADRGRGLGGAGGGTQDQRWGFLGGIGSPVREHRRGGNGWGSLYSLTDVSTESGTEENKNSSEEPTSPEVTCIGRVRARAPRCTREGDARSDVPEKLEASYAVHHTWSAAIYTRKARAQPKAPFSGPLVRPSVTEPQAPQAPLPSVAQVKQGRWRALLGLYRSKAAGEKTAAPQEASRDICLIRCRKTSFDRFGSHPGGVPEQTTNEPEMFDSERDNGGENPAHEEPTGPDSGHLLLQDIAEEHDKQHSAESSTPNQDEGTDSLQCVLLGKNSIPPQSALWERRQFSKPRALSISGTC